MIGELPFDKTIFSHKIVRLFLQVISLCNFPVEGMGLEAAFLKKLLSSLTVNLTLFFFFFMSLKMNVTCHHIQAASLIFQQQLLKVFLKTVSTL